ncbi:MAG: hypothetical protein MK212_08665 [Saprospiraceae bacterium]|nr:hypothetical protein [Saprospiraceae bacterium]
MNRLNLYIKSILLVTLFSLVLGACKKENQPDNLDDLGVKLEGYWDRIEEKVNGQTSFIEADSSSGRIPKMYILSAQTTGDTLYVSGDYESGTAIYNNQMTIWQDGSSFVGEHHIANIPYTIQSMELGQNDTLHIYYEFNIFGLEKNTYIRYAK